MPQAIGNAAEPIKGGPPIPIDARRALKALRRDVRFANYGPDLLQRAESLEAALPALVKSGELSYLKGLGIIAEVFDYLGLHLHSRGLLCEIGPRLRMGLHAEVQPKTEAEQFLAKQKIWLLGHYSQTLYRDHDYASAISLLNDCITKVEKILKDDRHPYHGTLARLFYIRGQCCRQSGKFALAAESFSQSTGHSYEGVIYRKDKLDQRELARDPVKLDRYKQEQAVASHRVAMVLATGYGWMSYTQGSLKNAEMCFHSARMLLDSSNDWVYKAYVELLCGCLARSNAGLDRNELAKAIEIINRAYKTFADQKHVYRMRAAYELALAYTYSREFEEAETRIQEVMDLATASNDDRWLANALVVHSRIHRRRGDAKVALVVAQRALGKAESPDLLPCLIDGLIARGEAYFDLGELNKAWGDFDAALDKGQQNIKIRAVCSLHLARTALKDGGLAEANRLWESWLLLKDNVEHRLIHALAAEVAKDLEKHVKDYTVVHSVRNLNPDFHVRELRAFLVKQAEARYETVEERRKALGNIGRTTYYNWKNGKGRK
jgi:tetratricopeptide (TPR) repeat protein